MEDFSRLSADWTEWASRGGLSDISTTVNCDDCQIAFKSNDYSVHLHNDDDWWVVDTVDDRGQRHNGVAKLSTFELAQKYLIWEWSTLARSSLASGPLGTDLYRQGYASDVEVFQVDNANIEVCFHGDCAILVSGDATIFSHVMKKSVSELEKIARTGIN